MNREIMFLPTSAIPGFMAAPSIVEKAKVAVKSLGESHHTDYNIESMDYDMTKQNGQSLMRPSVGIMCLSWPICVCYASISIHWSRTDSIWMKMLRGVACACAMCRPAKGWIIDGRRVL